MTRFSSFILLLIFLFCFCKLGISQEKPQQRTVLTAENTVVIDSTGMELPYIIWQKLYSSLDYRLKFQSVRDEKKVYMLVKLTDEEKGKLMAKYPKPRESDSFFKVGEKFSYFNFKDLEGKKFKTADLVGKVLVLNFWFINCPPCRKEIPDLNELVKKYEGRDDVVFIAIALDQAYEVDGFLKDSPFNYHHLTDGKYYAQKFGIRAYPSHAIVDKGGIVKFHTTSTGPVIMYWLKKSIDESL